jgi:hypothetical protein
MSKVISLINITRELGLTYYTSRLLNRINVPNMTCSGWLLAPSMTHRSQLQVSTVTSRGWQLDASMTCSDWNFSLSMTYRGQLGAPNMTKRGWSQISNMTKIGG